MPLTSKGKKIMASMKKQYGERAKEVFYASKNKGKISGVDKRGHSKKRKKMNKAAEKHFFGSRHST